MSKMIGRYDFAFDDKYFGISRNYHEREVPMDAQQAGVAFTALAAKIFGGEIDSVTETLDGRPFTKPVWGKIFQADMYRRGAEIRAAGELREGQSTGHGVVKYSITRFVPAQEIHFAFHRHLAMRGGHAFVIRPGAQPDTAIISHEIHAQPILYTRLIWPLFLRYFHDAVVEDIFDAGLDYLGFPPQERADFPWPVRVGATLMQTRLGQWAWTALSSASELIDRDWGRNPFNEQGIPTDLDFSSVARHRVPELEQ
ncbi:hypothetical protein [Nocardia concava]|uniref:hypothetical protein n=1 Tax=Nocardia concava TaxID=257281 RepID=UPI0002F1BA6B|nr:hypothetical protein [Nocardia concava]